MGIIILGKVSKKIIDLLSLSKSNNSIWLFVDYSEITYPKGFRFNYLIDVTQKKHTFPCEIKTITQQFGKYMEEIPEGWKTIIEIESSNPITPFVNELDTLDNWEKVENYIQLLE